MAGDALSFPELPRLRQGMIVEHVRFKELRGVVIHAARNGLWVDVKWDDGRGNRWVNRVRQVELLREVMP